MVVKTITIILPILLDFICSGKVCWCELCANESVRAVCLCLLFVVFPVIFKHALWKYNTSATTLYLQAESCTRRLDDIHESLIQTSPNERHDDDA